MSSRRPAIGSVTALEQAKYGVWDVPTALLALTYVGAVQRAGGFVIMFPPDEGLIDSPDEALDQIDGLLLPGGSDIDPACYGAEPHPETRGFNALRDRTEIALTRRAIERDMPVLGICRGMQLLNVAGGGTLHQHLPDLVGGNDHRRNPGSFDGSEHDVALEPGSLAARAAGEQVHCTKSHHHQGIDRLGDGLVLTGRSTLDDLPEAIEAPAASYVLGVQWHPEVDEASRVVADFVDEVRVSMRRREAGAAVPAPPPNDPNGATPAPRARSGTEPVA